MNIWKILVYLLFAFSLSSPVFADEDKPKLESASEKTSPEVKAPDRESNPSQTDEDKSPPEGPEGAKKAPDGSTPPTRDFLKLAEPKPLTEKKPQKKNVPWGGYWSAVYRNSPEEEEEPSPLPPPKKAKPVEQPLTLAEYKEVDYARFASGSYASEYADTYVKFRCRFASIAPEGMRLRDFPPPDYLNFMVVGPGSSMESLIVSAKKSLADQIFRMESGREITLYGRAHRLGLSGLTVVVDEIETKK
jgi:hypothetical protein